MAALHFFEASGRQESEGGVHHPVGDHESVEHFTGSDGGVEGVAEGGAPSFFVIIGNGVSGDEVGGRFSGDHAGRGGEGNAAAVRCENVAGGIACDHDAAAAGKFCDGLFGRAVDGDDA